MADGQQVWRGLLHDTGDPHGECQRKHAGGWYLYRSDYADGIFDARYGYDHPRDVDDRAYNNPVFRYHCRADQLLLADRRDLSSGTNISSSQWWRGQLQLDGSLQHIRYWGLADSYASERHDSIERFR